MNFSSADELQSVTVNMQSVFNPLSLLASELLQEAVMKLTFPASDENVEQQLKEPIDSNSSTVAQTDHCRTKIKTEWATKLKEEQGSRL